MKWKNSKRLFFSVTLLFFTLSNSFANEKSLILTMTDGSVNAVALLDAPILTFPQDSLQVETSNFNLKVCRRDFSFYTFGDFESTFSKENSEHNSSIFMDGDILVVKGKWANRTFSITDVEGRVYSLSPQRKNDTLVEVSLAKIPAGVYLLVLDELVFKFIRR